MRYLDTKRTYIHHIIITVTEKVNREKCKKKKKKKKMNNITVHLTFTIDCKK